MTIRKITQLLGSLLLIGFATLSHAEDGSLVDDAFDPFADYSDFVDASTEETDINFFKFGRMLSVGGILGQRTFTGTMGDHYTSDQFYGASFTYYLSLQFAIQVAYTEGKHRLSFDVPSEDISFNGAVTLSALSFHGKYYLNTQNFTKTISKYNPYIVGGISQLSRTTSNVNQPLIAAKDEASSFDLGVGAEYLFNNNKNYVSLQLIYHKADFVNEDREITLKDEADLNTPTGIFPSGDPISLQVSIGFNF